MEISIVYLRTTEKEGKVCIGAAYSESRRHGRAWKTVCGLEGSEDEGWADIANPIASDLCAGCRVKMNHFLEAVDLELLKVRKLR